MPIEERTLYASGNGDRWSLARDTETGTVFVRHRPNQASGGRITDQDLEAFLIQGGMPPEKQELLLLIGELVGQNGDADSDPVAFYP